MAIKYKIETNTRPGKQALSAKAALVWYQCRARFAFHLQMLQASDVVINHIYMLKFSTVFPQSANAFILKKKYNSPVETVQFDSSAMQLRGYFFGNNVVDFQGILTLS